MTQFVEGAYFTQFQTFIDSGTGRKAVYFPTIRTVPVPLNAVQIIIYTSSYYCDTYKVYLHWKVDYFMSHFNHLEGVAHRQNIRCERNVHLMKAK